MGCFAEPVSSQSAFQGSIQRCHNLAYVLLQYTPSHTAHNQAYFSHSAHSDRQYRAVPNTFTVRGAAHIVSGRVIAMPNTLNAPIYIVTMASCVGLAGWEDLFGLLAGLCPGSPKASALVCASWTMLWSACG